MIPYNKQEISDKDINAVIKVLKSKFITQGPIVKKFEKNFSKYVKSKYSISFNSCTSALHAAVKVFNLKKNDYVWTSPNSFVASANCVLYNNHKLDFVDIDENTGSISLSHLENKLKITEKSKLPKLLINVHFAGAPNNQLKFWKLSRKYNFKILEDACHALGGSFLNHKVGSCKWSDVSVFSFHAIKSITTGEGGMATTNNLEYAKKLDLIKSHGILRNYKTFKKKNNFLSYDQKLLGYNFRLNEFQSALGISQLKRINSFIKKRKKISDLYRHELKNLDIRFLEIEKKTQSAHHLFVIKVKENIKKKIINALWKKNIFVNYHYIPIYKHTHFKKNGFKNFSLHEMESYQKQSISLPIYPSLNTSDQMKIIKEIKKCFNN